MVKSVAVKMNSFQVNGAREIYLTSRRLGGIIIVEAGQKNDNEAGKTIEKLPTDDPKPPPSPKERTGYYICYW